MLRKLELKNTEGVLFLVFDRLVLIKKVKLMERELNANKDDGIIGSGFV